MTKRRLTDEEIEKAAQKEWEQKVAEGTNFGVAGPKTEEGKKKALQNLQTREMPKRKNVTAGGSWRYVENILDSDELELYNQRREDYLRDYDINSSADEITLHQALMEEVIYYRLMTRQANKPNLDLNKALDACSKRLNTALENLGALRKQRLKQDEKFQAVSIATIAQEFAREQIRGDIRDEIAEQDREEEEFLRKKREREYVDAEFTEVDEEESGDDAEQEDIE